MRQGKPGMRCLLKDLEEGYTIEFDRVMDAAKWLSIMGYATTKAAKESILKNIKGTVKKSYGRFEFYRI